jgi:hypothetical protein
MCERLLTLSERKNGCEMVLGVTAMEKRKRKNNTFPIGIVLLLTKGLLMGDPPIVFSEVSRLYQEFYAVDHLFNPCR